MLSELINAILQIGLFSLIPFIVYILKNKTAKGFWEYIGLKRSTQKANVAAIAVSLLFAGALLSLAFFNEEFRELVHDPASVTGKFKAMGFSA